MSRRYARAHAEPVVLIDWLAARSGLPYVDRRMPGCGERCCGGRGVAFRLGEARLDWELSGAVLAVVVRVVGALAGLMSLWRGLGGVL